MSNKLFNRQDYLKMITSEIAQLEHNLHTTYALIDDINSHPWGESEYQKKKEERRKLHYECDRIKRRLTNLKRDYHRYEKMDI